MTYHVELGNQPDIQRPDEFITKEITVPSDRYLHHILNHKPEGDTVFNVIPATKNPSVFESRFYTPNIGSEQQPIMLQLRFEPTPAGHIALLMTNERTTHDLETMGGQLANSLEEAGIEYDAVLAPDSLGSRLAQEVARVRAKEIGRDMWVSSFQKGKPRVDEVEGKQEMRIGPPKPWVTEEAGIEVSSGTSSTGVKQMLYLDQQIAEAFREHGKKTVIVDDACLSKGTMNSCIELCARNGIQVVAIATVLNEAEPAKTFQGVPFVWLTKLPLFDKIGENKYKPKKGTYNGLKNFYVEKGPAPKLQGKFNL